jgi:uncharacterized protein YndB with AHSA1/START domain
MRRKCEASVTVAASPEAVWAVISDVTRVGEWSGECRGCVWVDGADSPTPGARFRGRNRRGGFRWTRLNEVMLVERPQTLVWRTVARAPYPDSVEWRINLVEHETGTLVSESFEVLKIPRLMEWVVGIGVPAHRDRTPDLTEDLQRLKGLVELAGTVP